MAKTIPIPSKTRSYKFKSVSCSASDLAMQNNTMKTNFYEVLSLGSENAGFDEIKKAYRSMALQYHPDVCPDPSTKEECTRRFVELQKAYKTLSDPISRKLYDYELGLVESVGFGLGGVCVDERRSNFPKEVWERQLCGLKQHSQDRMERKKMGYM